MAAETTRHFVVRLSAPIPVGHVVVVQFYEKDTGIFSTSFAVDVDQPAILDRTTGIAYGAPWHSAQFFGLEEPIEPQYVKIRPAERVEGVVRSCVVLTRTQARTNGDETITVLAVDTDASAYR